MARNRRDLWPHLLALVWQALWIVLIIRLSSRLFRRDGAEIALGRLLLRVPEAQGRGKAETA